MPQPTQIFTKILLSALLSLQFSCTLAQPLHTDPHTPESRSDSDKDVNITWSKYAIIAIAAGELCGLLICMYKLMETVAGLILLTCGVFWYRKRISPDRIRKREEHERQEDYVRRMLEANTQRAAAKSEESLAKVSKDHSQTDVAGVSAGGDRV